MNKSIGRRFVAGVEVMTSQWLSQIEDHFWRQGFKRDIWMIVDAARDQRIFPMLQEFHLEYYCLYSGPLPLTLQMAAPYLLQLDHNDQDTRHFLRHAWGKSWGVFLKCAVHANALRRHLRELLLVRDPHGDRLLFRYYDPRVLRLYLPSCYPEELQRVFGPIERFWMEDKAPEALMEFGFDGSRLVSNGFSLESSAII